MCPWKPPSGLFLGETISTQPLASTSLLYHLEVSFQPRLLMHSNIILFIIANVIMGNAMWVMWGHDQLCSLNFLLDFDMPLALQFDLIQGHYVENRELSPPL
jgi:hypothetical protein